MGSVPKANGASHNGYTVEWDKVHSQPHKLRVICVGAGASGLYLAYRMKQSMTTGSWDLQIYDK